MHSTPYNWNDLRFFLAVARSGRLTAAARLLGAEHTTVSRRITNLERDINTKLFERRPQGYTLTEQGSKLLVSAEEMESLAIAAQGEISGSDYALSGAVRIGSPEGFGTYFLAPCLARLSLIHRDLEIQLIARPRVFSLSKREADIAISLERPREGRLHSRKLTDYTLSLFASRKYLANTSVPNDLEDLKDHRIIGYIDDLIFTPELDYLPEVSKSLVPKLASTSVVAQMESTKAGAGICILPTFMAANEPDLVHLFPDKVSLTRSFWLIIHSDMRKLVRIKTVSDFIAREIRSNRAKFMTRLKPITAA